MVKISNHPDTFQESFNFRLEETELESHGVKISLVQKLAFPEKGVPDLHEIK